MNFSRSASLRGVPLLDALSYSPRSALYCSAGVAGLSWPLAWAATAERLSVRARILPASRFMGLSPRTAAEPTAYHVLVRSRGQRETPHAASTCGGLSADGPAAPAYHAPGRSQVWPARNDGHFLGESR